jgi:dihydrofolate synthase/folylpolyglutamate synthase
VDITGIKGRWQTLSKNPNIICDTGHNQAAMEYILRELQEIKQGQLHMVLGFVNDKDISSMLELFPQDALYYFCSAKVPRSMAAENLFELAVKFHLQGKVISDPNDALASARAAAHQQDLIFVGGSTFVVAELNELK